MFLIFRNEATLPNPINWSMVANAGKQFVFIKASEGKTSNENPQHPTQPYTAINVQGAIGANVLTAPYHVAHPDTNPNPIDEATNFLTRASAYIGNGYLPPVLDLESTYGNLATLSQWTISWLQYVQEVTGETPIVYANGPTLVFIENQALANVFDFTEYYPLWVVDWDNNVNAVPTYKSYTWPNWEFKQFASEQTNPQGQCPGITGSVDLDSYQGDATALVALSVHAPRIFVTGVDFSPAPTHRNGEYTGQVFAPGIQQVTIQVSHNLVNWLDLQTLDIGPSQTATFTDPYAAVTGPGYYRAVQSR